MASVLALPFDVMTQIFTLALPPESVLLPSTSIPPGPLLFASICQQWREFAFATHELWNTVDLELSPNSIKKISRLLNIWIPRAGNLVVSMSLSFKHGALGSNYRTKIVRPLEKLLARYALQWISIDLPLPMLALTTLRYPEEGFPSLQKLILARAVNDVTNGRVDTFSTSKELRDVCIVGGTIKNLVLPWEQLTTLNLRYASVAECVQTLALVPNLVQFTANVASSGSPIHAPPLAHLASLILRGSPPLSSYLLDFLTLPALRRLELNFHGSQPVTSLPSLIARSRCSLRRLSVHPGRLWTKDHYMELFHALDSLEGLEIRKPSPSLDQGIRLLKAQQPHLLLPHLTSLSIESFSHGGDVTLLVDVIVSRWNTNAAAALPARLKSFRFTSTAVRSTAFARLRRLKEEGLRVQILRIEADDSTDDVEYY
ncbi:hypothetical protein B0H16DRAFT_1902879 [Mycena metata]|uniref:F-box domain-containing protein n=1 Tax=Mycena metata TaxID=1033252 RepID=A0AAD7DYK0_9AGAR|nr:hypothetical protein B0H16DRAFT_1902879 [Mycena metata]